MPNRGKAVVEDARVRRAMEDVLKSLGSSRKGKTATALVTALIVVAVAWFGAGAAGVDADGASGGSSQGSGAPAPAAEQAAAASDLADSAASGAATVSQAAYDAAARDAQRGSSSQRAHLDPGTFDRVSVRHVVDGDTIAVARGDGSHVSVRMVGIDTPESVAPQEERNCAEGVLASDHMKSLVGEGDVLWLQYDTSETDKYGRPLAYVWRDLPASAEEADDPAFIAAHMLNAIQVIDGYGQPKTYRPDTYHDGLFAQWGAEAAADDRGVTRKWA